MADLFSRTDAERLLRGKDILLIGDSNMRATYKDLICLLTEGTLLSTADLKKKGEDSFMGDRRNKNFKGINASREYAEDRTFKSRPGSMGVRLEFNFTTKVYTHKLERTIRGLVDNPPDVILVNSTLWDLSRWGPNGDVEFKKNLIRLLDLLKKHMPPSTMIVWLTALHPSSQEGHSPLIVRELGFIKAFIQHHILEANVYAASKVSGYGYNLLDVHYYIRLLSHRRRPDGVHYSVTAVRYITNLILTHIALSWQVKLPGRVDHSNIRLIQETIATESKEDIVCYPAQYLPPHPVFTKFRKPLSKDDEKPSTSDSATVTQVSATDSAFNSKVSTKRNRDQTSDGQIELGTSSTAHRQILRPRKRLVDANSQTADSVISKSAMDVVEESGILDSNENLDLDQFFGPDY